jgi:ankyrin repeat protein
MEVDLSRQNREVDPSASNNLPLRTACMKNYAQIVRFHTATWQSYAEIVLLLLNDTRVNPSDQNNKALIDAVNANNTEIVRILLEYGKLLF